MTTTLTHTHTERKYLKYVRHPVVYSASPSLFLLLVLPFLKLTLGIWNYSFHHWTTLFIWQQTLPTHFYF